MREVGYQLIEDCARYPDAPDFGQPALIFHGTRDAVVPSSYSEWYAATHPNVTLRLLDSDHQLTDMVDRIWSEASTWLQ
jgi:pimeloyl-ACP methyl ester carboxylesterase